VNLGPSRVEETLRFSDCFSVTKRFILYGKRYEAVSQYHVCKVFVEVIITSILKGFAVISKIGESYQICYLNSVLKHRKAIKAEIIRSEYLKRPICARCSQEILDGRFLLT
jgi:hypothetical protein